MTLTDSPVYANAFTLTNYWNNSSSGISGTSGMSGTSGASTMTGSSSKAVYTTASALK